MGDRLVTGRLTLVVLVLGVVAMAREQCQTSRSDARRGGRARGSVGQVLAGGLVVRLRSALRGVPRRTAHRSPVRGAAGVVMATVVVAASMGVWGAGLAAADSAGAPLHYMCTLSPFPEQPMTVQVAWDAPASVPAGRTTPTVTVTATATVGSTVTWALRQIGVATVEGSLDAPGVVVAPEGNISSAVRLAVRRTDVPASGPMTVQATGTIPGFVFHQPGHATVTVGNDLAPHVILRDASGNPTGPGEVAPSCKLDPGQNTVVFSFDIMSPAVPTPTTGIAGSITSRAGGPAGTGTQETITPGTSGSIASATGSTAPSTAVSGTTQPTVAPTADKAKVDSPAFTSTESWAVGPTGVDWWLVVAGIVAAGAGVIGGVRWLKRRRGRRVPRC